jgi:hypothetical protein
MSDINIAGLDKVKVLQALYERAKPQGMGFLHYTPGPLPEAEAKACLERHPYFDYLNGRVMKVDLGKDTLDPRLYDRDNGDGAAERALQDAGLIPGD